MSTIPPTSSSAGSTCRKRDAKHGRHPSAQVHRPLRQRPAIILVTDERSAGRHRIHGTTWSTFRTVGSSTGAMPSSTPSERSTNSRGTGHCAEAFNQVLDSQMALVPPILHFSKKTTGMLRFNGLCILRSARTHMVRGSRPPVRNYRAQLTILDEEFVDVAWLQYANDRGVKGRACRSDRVPGGDIRTVSSTDFACGLRRFGQQPRNSQPSARVTPACCLSSSVSPRPASRRLWSRSSGSSMRSDTTSLARARQRWRLRFRRVVHPAAANSVRDPVSRRGQAICEDDSCRTQGRLAARGPARPRPVRHLRHHVVLHEADAGGSARGPLSDHLGGWCRSGSHHAGDEDRPRVGDQSDHGWQSVQREVETGIRTESVAPPSRQAAYET